jgi:acyl-CoA synthetase
MSNSLLTLFSLERYEEYYRSGFWRDDTIYSLVAAHAARGPGIAIRSAQGDMSYGALLAHADAFASDLADTGVSAGQRVAVWSPSRAETVIVLLACSRNGYVCCPSLHRDHTVGDILALLARMRAVAVVAEVGYGADAAKNDLFARLPEVATVRHVYHLERNKPGGAIGIDAPPAGPLSMPAAQNPNRILYLAFTSGTTGVPKGVMHSDNTLLANARALAADWNIDEQSVVYSLSPLSHNLGFGAMIMALAAGGQIVFHDLPRGASLVDRLIETGTTFLVGVPTHAVDLLAEMKARNLTGVGRLKGFRISGASASAELISDLLAHGIVPQSGYGMTETCSHQYTLPDDDPQLIIESCGKACPGYEIRIFARDDANRELPASQVGQIGGRGASLMLGYFDDQRATEEAFNRDGWFMTGDLGWVDESGYLRVTGRTKDVIVRGGHNIYPAKIEALAATHEAVERVVAVPVTDQRLGERVCLAVMFRPGKIVSPEELLEHLDNGGLSKYEMPEFFLQIDEIPLTASGKIRKRDIVDWIVDGRARPTAIRRRAEAG